MLKPGQAGGMGGGDKTTGSHGKDTHQVSNERHIVVVARFKPKPSVFTAGGMDSAAGLLSSVTGAVDKVVGAVEDVMASIPGIQMFIKEDKTASPSEKEYKYEYAEWDSTLPKINTNIKKIFPDNKVVDTFEFDALDADGRKDAAKELFNGKLKSSLSSFSGYIVRIHLIGIGQGGNVMNEVSDLLAKDSQFTSENWLVKSVFYIGTPVYSDLHKFNEDCLKSEGDRFHFNCSLDLTQQVIDFFAPGDDFLKFIINSNSSTISLAVGKIKMSILKILSLFLGNSSISFGDPNGLDKFSQIKPEIENLVKQMSGMVKQIASEMAAFIDPGKLPDFGEALNGLDDVPDKSMKRFGKFISDLGDTLGNQAKSIFSGGGGVGPQDLMGVFNCLCPLFNQIAKAIAFLDYNTPASIGLANQMIDNAGITELYGKGEPEGDTTELNDVAADYLKERLKVYQDTGKVDKINQLIDDATALVADLGKEKITIKDLSDEKKIQLAGALYSIIQPMVISKKMVLDELQKWIAKLDIRSLLEDISANKLLGMANPLLAKLDLDFQDELKESINKVDTQLNRLKDIFKPHEYDLHKDTLYLIFNVHNVVINSFVDDVQYILDQQTGYIDYMQKGGCENQFTATGKNTYNPPAPKDSEDTMNTKKLETAPA